MAAHMDPYHCQILPVVGLYHQCPSYETPYQRQHPCHQHPYTLVATAFGPLLVCCRQWCLFYYHQWSECSCSVLCDGSALSAALSAHHHCHWIVVGLCFFVCLCT